MLEEHEWKCDPRHDSRPYIDEDDGRGRLCVPLFVAHDGKSVEAHIDDRALSRESRLEETAEGIGGEEQRILARGAEYRIEEAGAAGSVKLKSMKTTWSARDATGAATMQSDSTKVTIA